MSDLLPPVPLDDRAHGRTVVLLGALLGMVGVAVAVGFKLRCGMPADAAGQYLQWCYTDIPPLWFAERLHEGAIPYLDHPVEYPPLTGLWMWLASLPAAGPASFFAWTSALFVASGAVIGALLASTVGLRRTLVFAVAPTLLVSGAVNWDLPSMALATAGLVAHRRGRDGWAGVWLGLGTAAKLWPALLVLPIALAAGVLRGRAAGWRAVGGAAGAWLVINVPLAVLAPDGWSRFLVLNQERPADWDSLWRLVPGWLGLAPDVGTVNLLAGSVTLAGLVVLLVLALRWDPPQQWHLVALPLVAWFLLANKVWSPQFSLWLLPLLALATPRVWGLAAFAVADVAVTVTRFPYLAGVIGIEGAWPAWPFEVAVVVRAVVVAVVAWLGWRRAVAPPSTDRTQLRLRVP